MFASVVDNVATWKEAIESWNVDYKTDKEEWELLLSSSNQVTSNFFNGSYAGKFFSWNYVA